MIRIPAFSALVVLIVILATPSSVNADFALLDDFEAYETDNLRDIESPWNAPNTGLFTVLEEDGNQFLGYTWASNDRAGSRPLPESMEIGPGEEATLYLQFRAGPFTPNSSESAHFGLAHDVDIDSHAPVDDLRVEAAIRPGPSEERHNLDVRDGGDWRTVATVTRGVWYNLWFVIDRTDGDRFEAYLSLAADDAGADESHRLVYEGDGQTVDTFSFRDAGSPEEVLNDFAAYGHSGSNRSMHLDNLWIDNTGENLAFSGLLFEAWQVAFEALEAPFDLDFGTGSGEASGESLLRSRPQDFTLQDDALRYAPASDDFVSSGALAALENYLERQDFALESEVILNQISEAGNNRVGFAVLGGPHEAGEAPFNIEDEAGFYGLIWYPGEEDGTSYIRIREGFDGNVLAEEVWEGRRPFPSDEPAIFFEDFEDSAAAPNAWSSGGDGDIWEIGVPASGPGEAVSGDHVAATGLDERYEAHTDAWFRSPAIDLTDLLGGTLSFWEFTDVDDEGIEFHSTTVTVLDAQSLEPVEEGELSRDADQTENWRFRDLDLPADALGREVVVEFRLESDAVAGDEHDGWFIDDVMVSGLGASDPLPVTIHAEGSFDPTGALELAFTLSDEDGFEQTISATVTDPFAGNLFGIGGRLRTADVGDTEFDFGNFSMTLGEEPGPLDPVVDRPFNFAFGSDEGRLDPGDVLFRNRPDEWSLLEDSARLAANAGDYASSVGLARVSNFEPGEDFIVSAEMTLSELASGEADNRVGLVLFGVEDGAVFDSEDDDTYYTFQWIPNASSGASIALRRGMDGAILDEVAFSDLDTPPAGPEAGVGETYHLRFKGTYDGSGELRYRAVFADSTGGTAGLSGAWESPPEGNRFGIGARHRLAENPVWDFHRLDWLAVPSFDTPVDLLFGSADGRDSHEGFLISGALTDGWSLEGESLRHERLSETFEDTEFEPSTAVANAFDYTPGGDFAVRATVTPTGLELLDEDVKPVFLDFPDEEDYVALGTKGMDADSGTIEMLAYFPSPIAVWFYGQHEPEDQWNNRLQIKRDGIGFGDDSSALSFSDIEGDQWLRLSLAYDEDTLRYYVNGELKAEGSRPDGFEAWSERAYLMNVGPVGGNDRGANARVSDVRHWNYARTQEQIASDMNEELSGTESGLVGYWPLDEGRGDTAFDRSGNGNDGTIVGAQWRAIPRFGLTVLGESTAGVNPESVDFIDTSIRLQWLPSTSQGGGELRFEVPEDESGPGLSLAEVSGAPGFTAGETYTMEVHGFHDSAGNLELTGVVSDENGAEASLTYTMGSAESSFAGNWFGITGNNALIDWHTYQMGTPGQLGIDPPDFDQPTFEEWREEFFDEGELADENISGPGADPAGDGIANLLKYAFGLDPWIPAGGADLPRAEIDEDRLRLTYYERRDVGGIDYQPEMSEDLTGWEPEGVVEVGRVPDGAFDRVTVEADLPDGAVRGFLRVTVREN